MSIFMSGLDCHRAPVSVRETMAFSRQQTADILVKLRQQPGVEGCVLLSTCNRTELYISGSDCAPLRLLCQTVGADQRALEPYFVSLSGEDAAAHLMEVACGLHSQILGEDQIITQVRNAMDAAQEAKTSDSVLSALFRQAVTAGKRAKTQVHVSRAAPSMGSRCREVLEETLGSLGGKRILVIGNGQMGRLAASLLQEAGARVSVTLRSYRHGETIVPPGCGTVPYDGRIAAMEEIDAVVSATTSPHYTVTLAQLQTLKHPPRVAVDLAVPRDIEPACRDALTCFDTDDLGVGGVGSPRELAAMEKIAGEELEKFLQWQDRHGQPEVAPRFPLFVDLREKTAVLVGGGTIAARRIASLRQFGCRIVVISPTLCCSPEGITWLRREYRPGDLEGAFLAVAATDCREVNRAVGEEAKKFGIFVSVADCEAECSFYFPAVCTGDNLIAGVVSSGKDHHKTARAARKIREVLEALE